MSYRVDFAWDFVALLCGAQLVTFLSKTISHFFCLPTLRKTCTHAYCLERKGTLSTPV